MTRESAWSEAGRRERVASRIERGEESKQYSPAGKADPELSRMTLSGLNLLLISRSAFLSWPTSTQHTHPFWISDTPEIEGWLASREST